MNRMLPPVGTELRGRARKPEPRIFQARVVPDPQFAGGTAVDVDGRRFASMSEAARACCGYKANGWVWWKQPDGTRVVRAMCE